MSGRPDTYSQEKAIAQLMRDRRRPAIREAGKNLRTVYLYGEDLFVAFSDTIDWIPKLSKITSDGQSWGSRIEGWPTEEEIAAEIAASAEREKNWSGSLSSNDISALERMK